MTISFTIYGKPASYSAPARVIRRKNGSAYAQHYAGAKHKTWQGSVVAQALPHRPATPWPGAVSLSLVFVRTRPRSLVKHPGRCKDPKRQAQAVDPIVRPDILKLVRPVEDAMSGIFWVDDSQVITHKCSKEYGEADCVHVKIEFLAWDRE